MSSNELTAEQLVELTAAAAQLEDAGQLNLAKLTRAALDSHLRRRAYRNPAPSDPQQLADVLDGLADALQGHAELAAIVPPLRRGTQAMLQGRLPLYADAPHAFVCRVCGFTALDAPTKCPVCGAWADMFQKFPPGYWMDALDPFQGLASLRTTPGEVAALIDGLTEQQLARPASNGEWSMREVITHLRDAQGVLDYRSKLILEKENPILESQAVFEWATRREEHPPTTRDIFDEYLRVRQGLLARLEPLPLEAWWRTGQHLEFGTVRLTQQVSYFAAHEVTHLPTLEQLRAAL
jgi:hypothetical protein